MSDEPNEVSKWTQWHNYLTALTECRNLGLACLEKGGLVCAVGRDYRTRGNRVRLHEDFLALFESAGCELEEVWSSIPDIVLILRKTI